MRLRPLEDEDVTVLDQLYLIRHHGDVFVARIVSSENRLHFVGPRTAVPIYDADEKYVIVMNDADTGPIACNKLHQIMDGQQKNTERFTQVPGAVGDKLEVLIAGVCEYCRADPTAPSVILSLLPNGKYYAAVHRFTGRYAEGRTIVAKAVRATLEEAVEEVGRDFMVAIGRGPALDALVKQASDYPGGPG